MVELITENLELWSSAYLAKKTVGRGSSTQPEAYGIQKLRELIFEIAAKGMLVEYEGEAIISPLENVVELIMGQAPPGAECNKEGNGTIFVKTGEFGVLYPEEKEWTTKPLKLAREGDVLICVVGATVGKLNLAIDCAIGRSVAAIRPNNTLETKYLYYSLMPYTLKLRQQSRGSAQGVIGKSELNAVEIRLPSLEEQHRIVAKVDELMDLCDRLRAQQTDSIEAHQTLVETLLNTLIASNDAQEFQESWKRIAEHFETLFITEKSIETLKQTILQLAVMGKLVHQDPNDEPASVLLEKIEAEKERLVEEGEIKKKKALPPIGDEEKPFTSPDGWEWCRLQRLVTLLGDGLHGTPIYDDTGEYFFVNGNNLNDGEINIKPETKRVAEAEYLKHKKELNTRTVLVSINGTLGNVAFFNDEPIMLGKSACYFNLGSELSKLFFKRLIESPYFLGYAFTNATGSTIKNLGLKAMNNFPVALPPLEEQHRIVAKVDELMDLCDTLQKQLESAQTTQIHLADAIVEQAK